MIVARYFVLFIVFSVAGWLWECTFRVVRDHHWQNRGFLYGPLCPIYGTGAVLAMVLFSVLPSPQTGGDYPLWEIFLVCALGSAVLEFVTSWVLEKCFHAIWWDYSRVPLNIQGRICPPATCAFGIVGIVIVKWILPLVERLPVNETPLLNEAVSLVLAVFLGMDLALTVESLTRLTQRMDAAEERFNERMEGSVQTIFEGPEAVGEAVRSSAADAGETAAIAAMLAADAAKDKVGEAREHLDEMKARRDESAQDRKDALHRHVQQRRPEKPLWIPEAEWQARLKDVTGNLSRRDRYHIRSIAAYRPHRKGSPDTARKLRSFFKDVQRKAGKPEDRQVRKK